MTRHAACTDTADDHNGGVSDENNGTDKHVRLRTQHGGALRRPRSGGSAQPAADGVIADVESAADGSGDRNHRSTGTDRAAARSGGGGSFADRGSDESTAGRRQP